MEPEVKRDILKVLRKVYSSLNKCDPDAMKFASDNTLHNSSMYQDRDSISIAVVVYTLYKICSRERMQTSKEFITFQKEFLDLISEAQSNLTKNKDEDYRKTIKKMYASIAKLEKKFGMYITQVINQSRIKKGGRIYEHGISAGRAAELLGVTSWELRTYIGNTKLSDVAPIIREDMAAKIKLSRRIFNL